VAQDFDVVLFKTVGVTDLPRSPAGAQDFDVILMQTVGVGCRPRSPAGAKDFDVILMQNRWGDGPTQESCGCPGCRHHFDAQLSVWGTGQEVSRVVRISMSF